MAKLLMITGLGAVEDLARGKKNALYNTLEEFHKYWERIDIVAPRVAGHPVEELFDNVYIHCSSWPLILHPIFFIKKIITLNRVVHFDLMTVHEFPPFYNGLGAKFIHRFTRVPYVLEIMHIPGYPKAATIKEQIYRFLIKLLIKWDARKARAVRVINQTESPSFLIQAGIPKDKILYIPAFYVDLNVFKPSDEVKDYDLIFIGRLEKNKGLNFILEALKILKANHLTQNAKLLIVGDGPERKKINKIISRYSLPITMFGYAKDSREIAKLINKSKILVMPSYNEGGPRVVLEAMACGVPVIATPVGIVLDIIKNKESGLIIDWSGADIADEVLILLNDKQSYYKYQAAGLEIVKSFERQTAIKNYADKLHSLIS